MANYKIMTKDEQWTMKDNLSEKEAVDYWISNIQGNVSSLDRIIQDDEGNDYDIHEGHLEKVNQNWY
jgi:hypothetical protein